MNAEKIAIWKKTVIKLFKTLFLSRYRSFLENAILVKYYLVENPHIYVSLRFITLSTKAATGDYKVKRYNSRIHKQPGIRT
jgi:hypothetical protein